MEITLMQGILLAIMCIIVGLDFSWKLSSCSVR